VFANNAASELLRSDNPGSMLGMVLHLGYESYNGHAKVSHRSGTWCEYATQVLVCHEMNRPRVLLFCCAIFAAPFQAAPSLVAPASQLDESLTAGQPDVAFLSTSGGLDFWQW
jgi:hypothetical protein